MDKDKAKDRAKDEGPEDVRARAQDLAGLGLEGVVELMRLMRDNGMTRLAIDVDGLKLELERDPRTGAFVDAPAAPAAPAHGHAAALLDAPPPAPAAARAAAPAPNAAPAVPAEVEAPVGHLVKSPIVGVFYASPSPDAAPFVIPGTIVTPGQTLCIIEAMKLMNEVNSPVAGTIAEVLVKNGERVEYGQPMLRIV